MHAPLHVVFIIHIEKSRHGKSNSIFAVFSHCKTFVSPSPTSVPLFPSFRKSRQTDTEICPMMIFLSWLMTGEALSAPAKSHKPLRPAFYMFNYHCAHFDILFTLGSLTDVKLMIWAL